SDQMDKIDAIASLRDRDIQQAPILEPKQASAGDRLKVEPCAGTGRLRRTGGSLHHPEGERTQRTAPGQNLFARIGVWILQIDRGGRAGARKRLLYGSLLCVDACGTETQHQRDSR